MKPADVTRRRIQVLELRIRLERVAALAYDQVCQPAVEGKQDRIRQRLLFVLAHASESRLPEAYGLVQLGQHVYARTSDVLHGRTSMVNIPWVVIDEWREIVEGLEDLLELGDPPRATAASVAECAGQPLRSLQFRSGSPAWREYAINVWPALGDG